MQLVEKHVIKPSHKNWQQIDNLAYKCKNLYNAALYHTRQNYINNQIYKSSIDTINDFTKNNNPDYIAMPRKISQQTIRQVGNNMNSFYKLLKLKQTGQYDKQVHLPRYLTKNGRTTINIPRDAISKTPKTIKNKKGVLYEYAICKRELNITFKSRKENIDAIRIVPKTTHYVLEVVYTKEPKKSLANAKEKKIAAIDLGVNNLATVFYGFGRAPELYDGRFIKSVNRWFNKRKARLQSLLGEGVKSSRQIGVIGAKRSRVIDNYLHNASALIVSNLLLAGVTDLVIGYNDGWKQECSMGRVNNQSFNAIPHARFVELLRYKAELAGITVVLTEESYTSRASFIDLDVMPVFNADNDAKYVFSGYRAHRGLYKRKGVKNGFVNADVNGAANIYRKVCPMEFVPKEVLDVVVHPVKISSKEILHKCSRLS